jgi:uncharacterized membrane protein
MTMLKYRLWVVLSSRCVLALLLANVLPAQAQGTVVHAVLFYSPSCAHCHQVITEDLPPLFEKYGERLQVIGIDVTQQGGQALYQAAIQRFKIAPEQQGVPTLIVGDVVLVGSLDIPQQFPGLIEKHLAQGGVDWPDIPGMAQVLAAAQPTPTATSARPAVTATLAQPGSSATPAPPTAPATRAKPAPTAPPALIVADAHPPGLQEKLARDPLGNALAIAVLIGMALVVGRVLIAFRHAQNAPQSIWQQWAIPALSLLGLGIAAYLAYVETAQVAAVCGPVGDCNTVQQSEYALLFGVLPVGMFGLIGYMAILLAWLASRYGRGSLAEGAGAVLLAMTLFGTLFSIYLTFLEPFVIGATCAWCLTSAVVMTLLLWLTAAPGVGAISNLFRGKNNASIIPNE